MNVVVITQARLSSTRLHSKVLLPLGEKTSLDLHLKRARKAKTVNQFVVATTEEVGVEKISEIALRQGWDVFQGNLNDVLDRFYQAALQFKADVVVRLTSDCPLVDPHYIDDLVTQFLAGNVDYAANNLVPNLPDGFDAEVFTMKSLEKAWLEAKLPSEREHVTSYIWKNSTVKGYDLFSSKAIDYGLHLESLRVTLDQEEDYKLLQLVVNHLGEAAGLEDIVHFLKSNPVALELNSHLIRNSGYFKSLEKDQK